jgi:hypothetical protein
MLTKIRWGNSKDRKKAMSLWIDGSAIGRTGLRTRLVYGIETRVIITRMRSHGIKIWRQLRGLGTDLVEKPWGISIVAVVLEFIELVGVSMLGSIGAESQLRGATILLQFLSVVVATIVATLVVSLVALVIVAALVIELALVIGVAVVVVCTIIRRIRLMS